MINYLLQIKRHDLTDTPVAISPVLTRRISLSPDRARMLKKEFKRVFQCEGDGNDVYLSISLTPLEDCDEWTVADADSWLEEFKKRAGVETEVLPGWIP